METVLQGHYRTSSFWCRGHRVLFLVFHCTQEGWGTSTNSRPKRIEWVHCFQEVLDGLPSYCSFSSREWWLAGHPGFAGCLFSCLHPTCSQKTSHVCCWGWPFPVQVPPIWDFLYPMGFHKDSSGGFPTYSRSGYLSIYWWLAPGGPITGIPQEQHLTHPQPSKRPNQPSQILPYSLSGSEVHQGSYQYFSLQGLPASRRSPEAHPSGSKGVISWQNPNTTHSETAWSDGSKYHVPICKSAPSSFGSYMHSNHIVSPKRQFSQFPQGQESLSNGRNKDPTC